MATTTASLTLSSPDLTGDVLAPNTTATLSKAGVSTGLDQTTGVGRTLTTSSSQYTLLAAASYSDDKAHKVYIRVVSTNATEYALLTVGTQAVGRLYGGDWTLIPWDGTADIKITPSVATSFIVEHMLIFEA